MAPWRLISYDPKHVGVKWILCVFNIYVHKLVSTDNAFIDARLNYEIYLRIYTELPSLYIRQYWNVRSDTNKIW